MRSKRVISLLTGVIFILNEIALPAQSLAAANAISVSEVDISKSFQLEIPPELGTVETIFTGAGPTIIHIQEAHGNYEVQKNISKILRHLKDQYEIDTVLLEGNAFKLKPHLIRFFPEDMEKTRKIAEELAEKGIVSGPELFFLEEPDVAAFGIENLDAYNENGTEFVEVLKARGQSQTFLNDMGLQIERLTGPYLNKDLRHFLGRVDHYEAHLVPFGDWLEELKKYAHKHLEIDLQNPLFQMDWPMLLRLFTLKAFESKLDLTQFKKERERFLQSIEPSLRGEGPKGRKNLYREIERLLSAPPNNHRLPDPETGFLFERMVRFLPKDFDYKAYPNVSFFIGHLILQSELKGSELMGEINRLTDKISNKLAATDEEKKIVTLLKDHRLLKRLFRLELTPDDFETATQNAQKIKPSVMIPQFFELNQELRVRNSKFEKAHQIDTLFDKALEFYQGAKKRDRFMLENVQKRLSETGQSKAVVITGGFHSGPFQDYFENKNYNYALITPKMTEVKGQESYVEMMLESYSDRSRAVPETHRIAERIVNGNLVVMHHIQPSWLETQVLSAFKGNGVSRERAMSTNWHRSLQSRSEARSLKTYQDLRQTYREKNPNQGWLILFNLEGKDTRRAKDYLQAEFQTAGATFFPYFDHRAWERKGYLYISTPFEEAVIGQTILEIKKKVSDLFSSLKADFVAMSIPQAEFLIKRILKGQETLYASATPEGQGEWKLFVLEATLTRLTEQAGQSDQGIIFYNSADNSLLSPEENPGKYTSPNESLLSQSYYGRALGHRLTEVLGWLHQRLENKMHHDGNLAHEEVLQKPVFNQPEMEIKLTVQDRQSGLPASVTLKVKKILPKEEIMDLLNENLKVKKINEKTAEWVKTKFSGTIVILEDNTANINYIGNPDLIGVTDFLYQSNPRLFLYPLVEAAIKDYRGREAEESSRLAYETTAGGYNREGHLYRELYGGVYGQIIPAHYLAKEVLFASGLKGVQNLEDILTRPSKVQTRDPAILLSDYLGSDLQKSERAFMTLTDPEKSPAEDLDILKRLLQLYADANPDNRKKIDQVYYNLTRVAPSRITGGWSDLNKTETGRSAALQERIGPLLSNLISRFPNESLVIRDEGVSAGLLSEDIYVYLQAKLFEKFRYVAADLTTKLFFIKDSEGNQAIFTDAEGVDENFVQMRWNGIIYQVAPGSKNLILPRVDGNEILKRFKIVYGMYQKRQNLQGGYTVEEISAQAPSVADVSKKEPQFILQTHNIYYPVAAEEKAHLTIISNVLVPGDYYTEEQISAALQAIGHNTQEGGYVLIINERIQHEEVRGFADPDDTTMKQNYNFPYTVFERKKQELIPVEFSEGKEGKGFALSDHLIKPITIPDQIIPRQIQKHTATGRMAVMASQKDRLAWNRSEVQLTTMDAIDSLRNAIMPGADFFRLEAEYQDIFMSVASTSEDLELMAQQLQNPPADAENFFYSILMSVMIKMSKKINNNLDEVPSLIPNLKSILNPGGEYAAMLRDYAANLLAVVASDSADVRQTLREALAEPNKGIIKSFLKLQLRDEDVDALVSTFLTSKDQEIRTAVLSVMNEIKKQSNGFYPIMIRPAVFALTDENEYIRILGIEILSTVFPEGGVQGTNFWNRFFKHGSPDNPDAYLGHFANGTNGYRAEPLPDSPEGKAFRMAINQSLPGSEVRVTREAKSETRLNRFLDRKTKYSKADVSAIFKFLEATIPDSKVDLSNLASDTMDGIEDAIEALAKIVPKRRKLISLNFDNGAVLTAKQLKSTKKFYMDDLVKDSLKYLRRAIAAATTDETDPLFGEDRVSALLAKMMGAKKTIISSFSRSERSKFLSGDEYWDNYRPTFWSDNVISLRFIFWMIIMLGLLLATGKHVVTNFNKAKQERLEQELDAAVQSSLPSGALGENFFRDRYSKKLAEHYSAVINAESPEAKEAAAKERDDFITEMIAKVRNEKLTEAERYVAMEVLADLIANNNKRSRELLMVLYAIKDERPSLSWKALRLLEGLDRQGMRPVPETEKSALYDLLFPSNSSRSEARESAKDYAFAEAVSKLKGNDAVLFLIRDALRKGLITKQDVDTLPPLETGPSTDLMRQTLEGFEQLNSLVLMDIEITPTEWLPSIRAFLENLERQDLLNGFALDALQSERATSAHLYAALTQIAAVSEKTGELINPEWVSLFRQSMSVSQEVPLILDVDNAVLSIRPRAVADLGTEIDTFLNDMKAKQAQATLVINIIGGEYDQAAWESFTMAAETGDDPRDEYRIYENTRIVNSGDSHLKFEAQVNAGDPKSPYAYREFTREIAKSFLTVYGIDSDALPELSFESRGSEHNNVLVLTYRGSARSEVRSMDFSNEDQPFNFESIAMPAKWAEYFKPSYDGLNESEIENLESKFRIWAKWIKHIRYQDYSIQNNLFFGSIPFARGFTQEDMAFFMTLIERSTDVEIYELFQNNGGTFMSDVWQVMAFDEQSDNTERLSEIGLGQYSLKQVVRTIRGFIMRPTEAYSLNRPDISERPLRLSAKNLKRVSFSFIALFSPRFDSSPMNLVFSYQDDTVYVFYADRFGKVINRDQYWEVPKNPDHILRLPTREEATITLYQEDDEVIIWADDNPAGTVAIYSPLSPNRPGIDIGFRSEVRVNLAQGSLENAKKIAINFTGFILLSSLPRSLREQIIQNLAVQYGFAVDKEFQAPVLPDFVKVFLDSPEGESLHSLFVYSRTDDAPKQIIRTTPVKDIADIGTEILYVNLRQKTRFVVLAETEAEAGQLREQARIYSEQKLGMPLSPNFEAALIVRNIKTTVQRLVSTAPGYKHAVIGDADFEDELNEIGILEETLRLISDKTLNLTDTAILAAEKLDELNYQMTLRVEKASQFAGDYLARVVTKVKALAAILRAA